MKKPVSRAPRAVLRRTLGEERSKFVLVYPAQVPVQVIKVDTLLPLATLQCDYVLVVQAQELYVELKGSDVEHAVKQLHSTLVALRLKLPAKLFFVVHHHCPVPATKVAQLKTQFFKKTGYLLEVRRSPYEHRIVA